MKNAILLHLHYQDLWPEFWSYLKDIKDENTDLYVTVHTTDTEWYSDIKNNANEVYLIENKGVDFGGFLYAYNKIKHINYLTITKLHGKKRNPYRSGNIVKNATEWARMMFLPLIEKENHKIMLKAFSDESLFIYGAKSCHVREKTDELYFQQNIGAFNKINKFLNLQPLEGSDFIAGSIFTVSKKYLDLLFDNKEMEIFQIMEHSFPFPNNGTVAHGLERMIGSCVSAFGGTSKYI